MPRWGTGESARTLRPDKRLPCVTVTDSKSEATLQVQVKGYLERVLQKKKNFRVQLNMTFALTFLDFAVAILIWSLQTVESGLKALLPR